MLKGSYSYKLVKVLTAQAYARVEFSFAYIKASALYTVISESLNRYFADQFYFLDTASIATAKSVADLAYANDELSFSYSSAKSDSISATDVFSLEVQFNRDYSESFSISDIEQKVFEASKTDSMPISEQATLSLLKPRSDSLAASDSLSRVVQFYRQFSDAFTLDDLANLGDFQKLTTLDKGNVVGVSDNFSRNVQFLRSFADSYSLSESPFINFDSSQSDTVSVSDSFDRVAQFSRSFSDSASISDSESFVLIKPRSDSFSFSDQLAVDFDNKFIAETLSMQEEISADFNKGLLESLSPSDQIDFDLSNQIDDSATVSDSPSFNNSIATLDGVSVSESIIVVLLSAGGGVFNDGVFNAFAFNE